MSNSPRRIMRLPEVEAVTGYKRSTIYKLAKDGRFPRQRKIGCGSVGSAVGWDSLEIEAWINEKLEGAV